MMLSVFSCVYCLFVFFLWRNVFSDPLPIFKLGFFGLFIIELWVFFISFRDKFLNICTYFLFFSGLSFHFLDGVIWSRRVFNFDEVQCITLFCTFWFVLLVRTFGAISKKTLILSHENLLLFFFYEFYCFITYLHLWSILN